MESAYLYDDDGSQMYCCICGDGEEVILCDISGCCRWVSLLHGMILYTLSYTLMCWVEDIADLT